MIMVAVVKVQIVGVGIVVVHVHHEVAEASHRILSKKLMNSILLKG